MDPLTKTALLRTLAFAIFLGVIPWLFVLVEDSEESTIEAKYKRLRSLYRFMESKYNMTIEEFSNFSNMAIEALGEPRPRWTYFVALDFLVQAATTIGYGNITPRTSAGQLLCIPVSFFGIPLTILLLKSIGEGISKILNNTVGKFETKILHRAEPQNLNTKSAVIIFFVMNFLMVTHGWATMYFCNWTFVEGIYFWFITSTTIGFGDYLPFTQQSQHVDIRQVIQNHTINEDDIAQKVHPFIHFLDIVFVFLFVFDLCIVASVINSIAAATGEWKHHSHCSCCVRRKFPEQLNDESHISRQGHTNKSFSRTESIGLQQKPIRVETCNARAQLPNIQCELIG